MSEEEKTREDEVFKQELSVDDLEASSGGGDDECGIHGWIYGRHDDDESNCSSYWKRPMYGFDGNGFPNCAATVERDSNCRKNDGCYSSTVKYLGMRTDCGRTWQ